MTEHRGSDDTQSAACLRALAASTLDAINSGATETALHLPEPIEHQAPAHACRLQGDEQAEDARTDAAAAAADMFIDLLAKQQPGVFTGHYDPATKRFTGHLSAHAERQTLADTCRQLLQQHGQQASHTAAQEPMTAQRLSTYDVEGGQEAAALPLLEEGAAAVHGVPGMYALQVSE